jgi:hypothetical protein
MGALWTDARLWPTELDQHQIDLNNGFQVISRTSSTQEEQTDNEFSEKRFAIGLAVILAIFVSAICLIYCYLL